MVCKASLDKRIKWLCFGLCTFYYIVQCNVIYIVNFVVSGMVQEADNKIETKYN